MFSITRGMKDWPPDTGEHAYTVSLEENTGEGGLCLIIVDVSDPSAPKRMGRHKDTSMALLEHTPCVSSHIDMLQRVTFSSPHIGASTAGRTSSNSNLVARQREPRGRPELFSR
jgi:hypothetical protein